MEKFKIIAIVLLFVILAVVLLINFSMSQINYIEINKSDEALGINDEESNLADKGEEQKEEKRDEIINVLLFGLDKEESNVNARSDTIIIATLDFKNNKVKLSSLMRDMYVIIEEHGFTKLNHAYAYGGAPLAIKTINQNFDTNIRDYFMVDFTTLEKIIDLFGGVTIYIKQEELPSVFYSKNSAIEEGEYLLDGKQAVSYARIRYVGNGDFERTERQRKILSQIYYKVKNLDKTIIPNLILDVLPLLETSMKKEDIMDLALYYFKSDEMSFEQERFPIDGYYRADMSTGIYYLKFDTDATSRQIKDYIYNDIKPAPK